jgi:hypothetical protein
LFSLTAVTDTGNHELISAVNSLQSLPHLRPLSSFLKPPSSYSFPQIGTLQQCSWDKVGRTIWCDLLPLKKKVPHDMHVFIPHCLLYVPFTTWSELLLSK